LKEAEKNNVIIKMGVGIESFSKAAEKFTLQLTDRTKLETDFLLIATGGSPSEKNYQWLAQTGHNIIPPIPSLFTFNIPQFDLKGLEGVAIQSAKISLSGTHFKELGPLLVTHWGISGPAAIRLSAWAAHYFFENNYHVHAEINFIPDFTEETLKEKFNQLKKSSAQKLFQSKIFDELPWMKDESYMLEVSTPGLDQPLASVRQYKKNVGRELKVKLHDKIVEGKLTAVADEKITLEQETGTGKKKVTSTLEVPFSDIEKAFVLISFK
jgi:predicted flavoprotein YhiN